MNTFFKTAYGWGKSHVWWSLGIAGVIVGGGYWLVSSVYGGTGLPRYAVAAAERGSILSIISGSGTVSASNRVDVTPVVSGDVTGIAVSIGQEVRKGQTLVTLDDDAASREVANAELSLENAQITYDKTKQEFENQASTSEFSDVRESYKDGYAAIAGAFIDIPDILSGLESIYYIPSHSPYFSDANMRGVNDTAIAYKYQFGVSFDSVKKTYDSLFESYRLLNSDADHDRILAILNQTYDLMQSLADVLNGTYNTIDYIRVRLDPVPGEVIADKTSVSGYIAKTNAHITKLSSARNAIEDAKTSATNAKLNLKSAELQIKQAEAALKEANETLAAHVVRADFDGVVADVLIDADDAVLTNTALVTLITKQKIAEISLNEVDAARIKVGQKARLSFDAIDDAVIDGAVTKVDLVGTVNQGVVSYTIEIAFDTDDSRIKPGMTANADITADARDNALLVPSTTIKTNGEKKYVEVFSPPAKVLSSRAAVQTVATDQAPAVKFVETGLSDDTNTEIISGLAEGDQVVVRSLIASSGGSASGASNANVAQKSGNAIKMEGGAVPGGAMMIAP